MFITKFDELAYIQSKTKGILAGIFLVTDNVVIVHAKV